jgi:hypothetical protein
VQSRYARCVTKTYLVLYCGMDSEVQKTRTKSPATNFLYYRGTFLGNLRKTEKNLGKFSRCPGDQNPAFGAHWSNKLRQLKHKTNSNYHRICLSGSDIT